VRLLDLLIDTPPRELYRLLYKKLYKNPAIPSFDDIHPCVFVLSTGRVGSMTLARLLDLSPNLLVKHEPSPKLFRLSKANYHYPFESSEFSDSIFWTVREELINQALSSGQGYVETSPQATFFAPVILKAIPSVKFIHLVRHPADIVTSGMRRNWYGGHPSDNTRITPTSTDKYGRDWSSMNQLEKNAWLWTETNCWIMDFLKAVPENQHITVRAEDLYNKKPDVINDVFDFVGAEAPSQKRVNKVLSKKHNQQTRGDFPSFKNWTPEMKDQLRMLSGDQTKALGYDI
jgi:hypothetical protein